MYFSKPFEAPFSDIQSGADVPANYSLKIVFCQYFSNLDAI